MNDDARPGLLIREMHQEELLFAAECTAAEGWISEDLFTLEGFFLFDPHGCFIAELDGQPAGICIATSYGKSGFIGELIVRSEARGKGVGAALLNHGVVRLQNLGVETVYLDGVVKAVGLYERNGFRKVCKSWRFLGQLPGKASPDVRRMRPDDLAEVFALDYHYFGADRSFFIKRRMEKFPELSYVLEKAGRITGSILGRSGDGWISIGPWMVHEDVENPAELLNALAYGLGGKPFSLGVLGANRRACELVHSLGFVEREDSPWRMALGPSDDLGASPGCYAIGSAAKG